MAYSAIMLGVLLPKLNIWMTKHQKPKNQNKKENIAFAKNISMDDFIKQTKTVIK